MIDPVKIDPVKIYKVNLDQLHSYAADGEARAPDEYVTGLQTAIGIAIVERLEECARQLKEIGDQLDHRGAP